MLSVIVIVKNEEANLRVCLNSVRWADEIIVLDSGSTDNTLAVAKEFTDKVKEKAAGEKACCKDSKATDCKKDAKACEKKAEVKKEAAKK